MFLIIIEMFSAFDGIDIIEVTKSIFRDEQAGSKLEELNPIFYRNMGKLNAA